MELENWKSDWITVQSEDKDSAKSPYFVNDFNVNNKIVSANLYITSRGVYEVHVNGQRVGDSFLTPGWTSYNNRIQYQAYDVLNMIFKGNNRLGVILGNGWFKSFRPNNGKRKTDYGEFTSFISELVITYADGKK